MDYKPYSRNRICIVEGCGLKHCKKGYCHKHHEALVVRGGYKIGELSKRPKECLFIGCGRKVLSKGYCRFHYSRYIRGVPLDLPYHANRGIRSGHWNGGTSEYPNHSAMKKVRKVIMTPGKLCSCGRLAQVVHHIDCSKTNHAIDNFLPMCCKCHTNYHFSKNKS